MTYNTFVWLTSTTLALMLTNINISWVNARLSTSFKSDNAYFEYSLRYSAALTLQVHYALTLPLKMSHYVIFSIAALF